MTEKPSHHLASPKSETATSRLNIDFPSFLVTSAVSFPREYGGRKWSHGDAAHACMHDVRRIASKGYHDFPMQIAKVAQPAKITVGNNAVDWEVELARASRETDNISLGRPLRRTIK